MGYLILHMDTYRAQVLNFDEIQFNKCSLFE